MKRILYIAFFLLTLLPIFMEESRTCAQNMASESYNPYSPWNLANNTNKYYMERCKICDVWISGSNETLKNIAMKEHMTLFHPETGDTGSESDHSSSSNNTNPVINGSPIDNYTSVIDIYDAAQALAWLGIYDANWFVEDYNYYAGSYILNDRTVTLSKFLSFVRRCSNIKEIGSIEDAQSYEKFILLSKESSSGTTCCIQDSNGQWFLYYRMLKIYGRYMNFPNNQNYELIYVLQ